MLKALQNQKLLHYLIVILRQFIIVEIFLIEQKYKTNQLIIYQDNLSAIGIIHNGGSFNRSKHMVARHGFVKQHMELGDVIFQHCPGDVMPADMLTKPLDGTRLKKLSELVNLTDT